MRGRSHAYFLFFSQQRGYTLGLKTVARERGVNADLGAVRLPCSARLLSRWLVTSEISISVSGKSTFTQGKFYSFSVWNSHQPLFCSKIVSWTVNVIKLTLIRRIIMSQKRTEHLQNAGHCASYVIIVCSLYMILTCKIRMHSPVL